MINQPAVISVVINGLPLEIGIGFMSYGVKRIKVDKSTTIENIVDALGLPSSESAYTMCNLQSLLKSQLDMLNTQLSS